MKSILVIGAGGFIGGFIAKRALEARYDTYVGVRQSTSRRYLSDERLKFVVLDYDDTDNIERTLTETAPSPKGWDYIIWNLGATKCANFQDFNRINYRYLADFVSVLKKLNMVPEKFLYMSSLSALGMGDEKTYAPLTSKTIPRPNTRYGLSKIKAEMCLETQADIPWIIFRPTGVYGPHEQDYLMMIKSIDRHCDVSMGFKKQVLTFIYVDDLVDAMFKCLDADTERVVHKKYIISENQTYTQKEFRNIVAKHLGTKFVVPICLPMWMVYAVSVICEKVAAAQMKASTLNRDKFKIMKQRNWNCDISDAQRDFGFDPQWSLDRGIAATVEAYKQMKQ
jgi:nucleoside-diphosphate-sugar epimerase